ncbi:hypothetical protein [Xanthomonas translucens]|uniref:hypothetical protein n=1 Tax=Xanthomonas campestris pv. translucens TaxID=343 RepID=UPI0012D9485C|nr:hypothetical protein [Xanthomonas translucens]UPU49193.1 hypothetical protein MZO50_01495 [Xanthomonas translucens pv. undulosa]
MRDLDQAFSGSGIAASKGQPEGKHDDRAGEHDGPAGWRWQDPQRATKANTAARRLACRQLSAAVAERQQRICSG